MDWNWKELDWDPAGLEQSNGRLEGQKNGAASVDLRLGEASELVEKSASETPKDPRDSKTPFSPSGSSKRSRMHNGSQNMSCSVDGCNSDLSNCREYHRRHRVCEKHSKTPIVLVGGKQQRFCQQCSRFHSLGEFDEVKRSCRKRLDGHNRRRRKPQPPSLFMAAEKFLGNYKVSDCLNIGTVLPFYDLGPRLLQFGSPQTYANPIMRSMWPVAAKTGAELTTRDGHRPLDRIDQQSLLSSFTDVQHRQDKQLPLLQATGLKAGNGIEAVTGMPICQPISGAAVRPASGKGSQKLSFGGKPGSFDSGCALYLLSTLQTQGSDLNMVQSSITCPMQSTLGDVNFDAGDKYACSEIAKDKPNDPALVLEANTPNLHCNGMLPMGPDGSVENGGSLTLPFFWE